MVSLVPPPVYTPREAGLRAAWTKSPIAARSREGVIHRAGPGLPGMARTLRTLERVTAGALLLVIAGGPTTVARAQEAPICITASERLDDFRNVFHGTKGRDSVTGLRGRDEILGRGGDDKLNGGRDNDVVRGGPGDDLLCGGRGTDRIFGGPGDDTIYGEEENDTVIPGPGEDRVLGSAGNDHIYGWGTSGGAYTDDGVDVLSGGYNDDVVEAGGADSVYGHTHADLLLTRTPLIAPAVMDGGGNDDTVPRATAAPTRRSPSRAWTARSRAGRSPRPGPPAAEAARSRCSSTTTSSPTRSRSRRRPATASGESTRRSRRAATSPRSTLSPAAATTSRPTSGSEAISKSVRDGSRAAP